MKIMRFFPMNRFRIFYNQNRKYGNKNSEIWYGLNKEFAN